MAKPSPKFGHMDCEGCASASVKTRVTVRKNERGTLSYQCDECDATPYAHAGTGIHDRWMKKIAPIAASSPPPPQPGADKKPAATPGKPKFGLKP